MSIAKIENGTVVQVDRTTSTAPEGWVACDDSVVCGMLWDGNTFTAPEPPAPEVPQAVGRAQAKIWLHRAGKLTAVQTYIDGANNPELALWWDEATTFERQNPHILALAAGFDIDLDTAFREAAEIA